MDKKNISILLVDRNLGENRIHHLDKEEEALRLEGYNTRLVKDASSLETNYDIIVAHPGWGEEAKKFIEFHREHPEIPMIVNTFGNLRGKKFDEYSQDNDGIYARGLGTSLETFLDLIETLSEEILRKRNI